MAEYVVEFGKDGRPSNPTAGSTLRHFTATIRRSGPCCSRSSPENPATCWRPAAAPANMWSISPAISLISPGGRRSQSAAPGKHRAWRVYANCRTSAPPRGSIFPIPAGAPLDEERGPRELLAILCADVIHIAPWPVAEGLFAGAGRCLRADGRLSLRPVQARRQAHRGQQCGVRHHLRGGNPGWGVRDSALEALAANAGLWLIEIAEMPANNMILVFGQLKTA